jgi:hypothetical protein
MSTPTPDLSILELQALAVGVRDAECGCEASPRGRLAAAAARLWRAVSGERGRLPLADSRLEALRQFACRTRRAHRPAEQLIPELLRHGYRPEQIGRLAQLAA